MMTRRTRLTIVVLILLALLLLLLWLLYILFRGEEAVRVPQAADQIQETEEQLPDRPTISEEELEAERETRSNSSDLVSLSKTFVTRYGSYSNEANFANLTDVMPLMTSSFAADTQTLLDSFEAQEEYYGVSTRVITVDVQEENEGTARVVVTTQREESVGSPQNTTVKFQDIVLTFVKEDGMWKVDSAIWQ